MDPRLMLGTRELEVADVLRQCSDGFVPVNVRVPVAIAAHRADSNRNTLRVVILAYAPTVDDLRQQLEYLGGLPDAVWHSQEDRDLTLNSIGRSIARQIEP